MSDEKSVTESIVDKIKQAAIEAEKLADKIAADEEPNVVENPADQLSAGQTSSKAG